MDHIDFEYILGNDPKPFAPPMRLSEQMVMAMGGRRYSVYLLYWYKGTNADAEGAALSGFIVCRSSKHYLEFQKFCCKAYLILRKHARLFLNLLDLARDLNATSSPLSFRRCVCM